MADRVLPPGMSERAFERALGAFRRAVGEANVYTSADDLLPYFDLYPLGDAQKHAPSAVVAPGSVEEIQAVVRLASEHGTPLWPVSRGKNLGYGGAAPRARGTVVLDLGRLNRILEVDAKLGYCLVEPGVGFYDLYDHLRTNNIPLWLATPGNAWGSVLGNALDRGNSTGPFGDHASKICGLEVVLADGSVVRTGMGAMEGNPTWPLFKWGYGPAWDQMFTQSSLGIVTKLGLWLMPEPEATQSLSIELPRVEDLSWAVDELFRLKSQGVVQQNPSVSGWMRVVGRQRRDDIWRGQGAMPRDAIEALLKAQNLGWWGVNLRLYGHEEVNAVHARIVREAFGKHTGAQFRSSVWRKGEPYEQSGAGIPSVASMQLSDWRGGRGAHVTFSPVLPPVGELALAQHRRVEARFAQHGLDYYGGFVIGERHMIGTCGIIYNRDDAGMTAAARALFTDLLSDAQKNRYGEYRTHLAFMDDVARSFDFGNNALLRLNERVKDALDPKGVIAPGKQGVWPRALRGKGL